MAYLAEWATSVGGWVGERFRWRALRKTDEMSRAEPAEDAKVDRKREVNAGCEERGHMGLLRAGPFGIDRVDHVCGWPAELERYYAEGTEKAPKSSQ